MGAAEGERAGPRRARRVAGVLGAAREYEKGFLFRHLGLLVRNGYGVPESLRAIAGELGWRELKAVVLDAAARAESGMSLSAALGGHPRMFEPHVVAAVGAGEKGGALPEACRRVSDLLRGKAGAVASLVGVVAYPAVVACALVVVGLQVVALLADQLREHLRGWDYDYFALLQTSKSMADALVPYALLMGGSLAAVLVGAVLLGRNRPSAWRRVMHKAPFLDRVLEGQDLARFAGTLRLMIDSGVPLVEALRIAAPAAGAMYSGKVAAAAGAVEQGKRLSAALAETGGFSSLVIWYVESGERNQRLGESLGEMEEHYSRVAKSLGKTILTFMGPALILFVGALVGVFLFLLMSGLLG